MKYGDYDIVGFSYEAVMSRFDALLHHKARRVLYKIEAEVYTRLLCINDAETAIEDNSTRYDAQN